jgi:hypothetical protein
MNLSKHVLYFVVFFLFMVFVMPTFAQVHQNMAIGKYPKGRIFLYDGRILEGKRLIMSGETVSLLVYGATQTFDINEVQQVMAKKGHASLFACSCGLGCLGLTAISYAITNGEIEDEYGNISKLSLGEYALGSAIWAGLCAGVGYLIGYIFDDWSVVFYQPRNFGMKLQVFPESGVLSKNRINNMPLFAIKGSF